MRGARPWIAAAGFLCAIGVAPAARGQVAFSPQVGAFQNGVVLSATPVVSFDRRYVRLGMLPQFTALEGFDTFSVPAAVGGVGAGPGMGGLGGAGGGLGGMGGGGGAGGLMGFAGMNGPIDGSMPQAQGGFPEDGPAPRGRANFSNDFEDQLLQPVAPPARKVAARHAPQPRAKRKVATKAGRPAARTSAQPVPGTKKVAPARR